MSTGSARAPTPGTTTTITAGSVGLLTPAAPVRCALPAAGICAPPLHRRARTAAGPRGPGWGARFPAYPAVAACPRGMAPDGLPALCLGLCGSRPGSPIALTRCAFPQNDAIYGGPHGSP